MVATGDKCIPPIHLLFRQVRLSPLHELIKFLVFLKIKIRREDQSARSVLIMDSGVHQRSISVAH